jgi:hypothetical protein
MCCSAGDRWLQPVPSHLVTQAAGVFSAFGQRTRALLGCTMSHNLRFATGMVAVPSGLPPKEATFCTKKGSPGAPMHQAAKHPLIVPPTSRKATAPPRSAPFSPLQFQYDQLSRRNFLLVALIATGTLWDNDGFGTPEPYILGRYVDRGEEAYVGDDVFLLQASAALGGGRWAGGSCSGCVGRRRARVCGGGDEPADPRKPS